MLAETEECKVVIVGKGLNGGELEFQEMSLTEEGASEMILIMVRKGDIPWVHVDAMNLKRL